MNSCGLRRLFLAFGAALGVVSAVLGRSPIWGAEVAGRPPIRIGHIAHLTGIYAAEGKDEVDGARLAFEETRYSVGGRVIQHIVEDDEANPPLTLSKTRKLVEADRVHALIGIIWSPSALAIRDYVHDRQVPTIFSGAAVRELTQERRSPYVFRTSFASGQDQVPFGRYVYRVLGYRRAIVFGFDSPFGREQGAFFRKGFEEAGGRVIQELYAPIATADFAPFLARLRVGEADVVWAIWSAAAAVRFVKQWQDLGFKDRIALVGFQGLIDERVLEAVGAAAEGIVAGYWYWPEVDTIGNRRFAKMFRERYGREPSIYAVQGYLPARVLVEAVKLVGARVEDREEFVKAIRRVRFDAPPGRFRFDEFNNPVWNIYMARVRLEGGRPVRTIIGVVHSVEQIWPGGKPASR
jgi:branched-chain amino acid transport system substrate-binding protein